MPHTHDAVRHASLGSLVWIVVIAGSSLGFTLGFACATPFAALAAVAATQLRLREAVGAVLLAWLGNQAIGYGLHGYPRTWDSFAWGGAIGLAALLTVGVAAASGSASRGAVRIAIAFAVAFAAYEGGLFAVSFVLPSEGNAFAPSIVARIFEVNAIAYAGLLVLHRLAIAVGLLRSRLDVVATGAAF